EERRANFAMHHRLWVAEEVLVVRALRGAVRQHQRSLSAAARATAALRIVRGRRRDVAQVDGVQRRDIDTKFHRRRAEEDRQEAVGLADLAQVFLVGAQLLAFLQAEAEALLAHRPLLAVDLRGVLARLETEEWVNRLA